jgi:SAM-dependent methyltransferase
MEYTFNKLDESSLRKLYSDFGFRMSEIGAIVGVSEDAILKRAKIYGIPTNHRNKERMEVDIHFEGKKKDKRKDLTDSLLKEYCQQGLSDKAIALMFNMTGEGIAYRRKGLGIEVTDKPNACRELTKRFVETETDVLTYDYYNLTQENFSKKYGVSKVVWRPILKDKNILNKSNYRLLKYPPFTPEQHTLILGSLLGDGSVSGQTYFYEFHSFKQEQYLRKKFNILKPYSVRITPADDGTGLRLSTVHHPNFRVYYDLFYEEGVDGKLIPVDYLASNWHDDILAYWFFDDGHYNDEADEITIANKCPYPDQMLKMTEFLESKYGWRFHCNIGSNIYHLSFSKEFYSNFVDLLLKVITPDLYYKIPERCLTPAMVDKVDISCVQNVKPKFYRVETDEAEKRKIENLLFDHLKQRSFPFSSLTEERRSYLAGVFKRQGKVDLRQDVVIGNTVGMNLCEDFFPNIYEAKRKGSQSPVELWANDEFLRKLSVNRLRYADRLTDSSLRTGIKILTKAVTNFKPSIARYFYQQYAPNGRILDYCCGFGARMLAAMSLGMEYVGFEPNLKTLANLQKFGKFLKGTLGGTYSVYGRGSEEMDLENYFDFAFSSPPFFDFEIYSEDPGQSIKKFPVYEDWLTGFWRKTIENCKRALRDGGHFGFCVSMNQHEHIILATQEFCKELGLSLVKKHRVTFNSLFSPDDKYDQVMIFRK